MKQALRNAAAVAALAALLGAAGGARAASPRLYTPPDPSASGGIKGAVERPDMPIELILAIPPDEPRRAYKGTIVGDDRRGFLFEGLPMRKYDLFVAYEGRICEGFRLHRGKSTLTDADRAEIEAKVKDSEPFFTRKAVHRLEGATGRGNFARCICTFAREKGSIEGLDKERKEHRLTFKLVVLKHVGVGWQIVRARDLHPVYVQPGRTKPGHQFSRALQGIRVTDYVKDLGRIDLVSK